MVPLVLLVAVLARNGPWSKFPSLLCNFPKADIHPMRSHRAPRGRLRSQRKPGDSFFSMCRLWGFSSEHSLIRFAKNLRVTDKRVHACGCENSQSQTHDIEARCS